MNIHKKIALVLVSIFFVNIAFGQETASWKPWFDNLLKGLKTEIQKRFKTKTRIAAVCAVRGELQDIDPMELYWKGSISEKAQKKLDEEKKKFKTAVESIVDGKIEEGRKLLQEFLKENPKSLLVPDVKEALSKLPESQPEPDKEKQGPDQKPEEDLKQKTDQEPQKDQSIDTQ
ncbi:MAG: hypothetical protein AB1633_11475 [Elusimicrobiota bacterium]